MSYNLPAEMCKLGSKLAKIQNTVCNSCYALKGFYKFPAAQEAMNRRWKIIEKAHIKGWNDWVEAMSYLMQVKLLRTRKREAQGLIIGRDGHYFRWHDSGDIQSVEHLEAIASVARKAPEVNHWLPTREFTIVKEYLDAGGKIPNNLMIKLSLLTVGTTIIPKAYLDLAKNPSISLSGVHKSRKVPKGFKICPASIQEGQCKTCRLCWSKTNVSYAIH